MTEKVLKINEVSKDTTLSRATIYRNVKLGTFPPPVQLSARRVGWLAETIARYLREEVA